MLEFILSIPENIGWAMVGFTVCLCVIMLGKLAKIIVEMIKDRFFDDDEGEEEQYCC